jgi:transcriptional regulator with XRE-family HTH domain
MTAFYKNLKAVTAMNGINDTELARITGICRTNFTNWKQGSMPSQKCIEQIATALNVDVDLLLDDTPEVKRNLTVAEVAKRCGKSTTFISNWLQSGTCPFGVALMGTGEHWDYFIAPMRLEKWLDGDI